MTKYYFLGIGGIGMSAIARYFNRKGQWITKQCEIESKIW